MNCSHCGTANQPGSGFCNACGHALASAGGPPPGPPPAGAAPGLDAGAMPPGAPPPQAAPGMLPSAYADPNAMPGPTRTSGMAIAGFVLSFFCGLLGLILSIVGYNECKNSGGTVTGEGLAIAGIVISAVSMLIGFAVALG